MDLDKVVVRDAVIDDLPSIVDIYNSTIKGRMVTADLEDVTVESKKEWFCGHNPDKRPMWVAEYNGRVAGWLSFQSFYGRPAYNKTVEISIYISEDYRRMGLGHLLIQRAIDRAPELNITTILGFIFGHNKPSLNLFYSYGFKDYGVLPGIADMDGILRDLVIVGKRI